LLFERRTLGRKSIALLLNRTQILDDRLRCLALDLDARKKGTANPCAEHREREQGD